MIKKQLRSLVVKSLGVFLFLTSQLWTSRLYSQSINLNCPTNSIPIDAFTTRDLNNNIYYNGCKDLSNGQLNLQLNKLIDKAGQVFNVKAYGASGNSITDDTLAIQNTINTASTSGGIVFFPPGTYLISSTLTVNNPMLLLGAGIAPDGTAESTLKWTGNSTSDFLRLNSGTSLLSGVNIRDLAIDMNGLALTGIHATSLHSCGWENVSVLNPPSVASGDAINSTAIIFDTNSSTFVGQNDFAFNVFSNISVGNAQSGHRAFIAMQIKASSASSGFIANFDHNTIMGLRLTAAGNNASSRALLIQGGDNNEFFGSYLFVAHTTGYGLELKTDSSGGDTARSYFFYHLESGNGVTVDASSGPNWIYGYDTNNSEPLPTITSGGKLVYTTDYVTTPTQAGASINLTGQTASIGVTTLFTTGPSNPGLYRVSIDLICTTAGTGGTVSATIGWGNGAASVSTTTSTISLTSLGQELSQIANSSWILYAVASTNITYQTTVASATGNPQYSLRIRLEFLG